MSHLSNLATGLPCDYCGADVGEWCIARPSGDRAAYIHEARLRPICDAFSAGFDEGQADILDAYLGQRPYFTNALDRRRKTLARQARHDN